MTAVDLFCGAGGLSLGLQESGFNVILGVDSDKNSVATHGAHFGGASVQADLSKTSEIDKICSALNGITIDLIAGGPPCQPFSRAGSSQIKKLVEAGKRPKVDPRRELWRGFVEVVRKLSPRAVVVENVPDIALGKSTIVLRKLIVELEELGYSVSCRVIPTMAYGVPQHRQRLFLIGLADGMAFDWPEQSEEAPTVRDAIYDLPAVEPGSTSNPIKYDGPISALQKLLRKGAESEANLVYDHVARRVREDDLLIYRDMDSQTKYDEIDKTLQRYKTGEGFKDRYKRQSWDEPCRTITAHLAKDGYWYIHPSQNRTLTIREAARIQTFPDWFRFNGFPTSAFQQIGNAVPPLAARLLGQSVIDALSGNSLTTRRPPAGAVATVLRDWIKTRSTSDMMAPWRKSPTLWHSLMGQILFEGMSPASRRTYWPTIASRWPTPEDFLADHYNETVIKGLGQKNKSTTLKLIAQELVVWDDSDSNAIPKCTGLTQEKIKHAMTLSGDERGLQPTLASVRVSGRVLGEESNQSAVDGQLLLAQLVGDIPDGRAYAAVLEIGDAFCHQSKPACRLCPLQHLCSYGLTMPDNVETALPLP